MSSVIYDGPNDFFERVERDGYFVIKNFFNREAVLEARKELKVILDKDDKRRKGLDLRPVDKSVKYTSIQQHLMHSIWFPSMQSPAYLKLVNDLFSHPYLKSFMENLAGDNCRMRIDLIRRSSGFNDYVDDFQIPHMWHRDTLGEFTFGMFFDDMPEKGAGGTAVIKGTHWDARDARWDLLLAENENFSRKHHLGNRQLLKMPKEYADMATLNQKLRKRCQKNKEELTGQMGDFYFFLNDVWHGRAGNTTGKRWMISRFGGFATEFPFKDDIDLPEGMDKLPEPWSTMFNTNPKANTNPNTLMRRLAMSRKPDPLTYWAAKEKDKILKKFYAAPEQAEGVGIARERMAKLD